MQDRLTLAAPLQCAADGRSDRLQLPHEVREPGRRQGLYPVGQGFFGPPPAIEVFVQKL